MPNQHGYHLGYFHFLTSKMLHNCNDQFENHLFVKSKIFYVIMEKYSNKKSRMDRNSLW